MKQNLGEKIGSDSQSRSLKLMVIEKPNLFTQKCLKEI